MLKHVGTEKIETKDLILRKFKIDDAEEMFNNWAKDPDNVKFLSWQAHKNIDITKKVLSEWVESYKKDETYRWGIVLKENGQLIGGIDMVLLFDNIDCCEIGYVLSKKYWNRGLMTEALKSVINYLFKKANFNRIQLRHHVDNEASGRVMQKAGLQFEGILREADKTNTGQFCDTAIYSILKRDQRDAGPNSRTKIICSEKNSKPARKSECEISAVNRQKRVIKRRIS